MIIRPVYVFSIILIAAVLLVGLSSSHAGVLRDRLKERVKNHLVQKLEDTPPPAANAAVTDKIVKPGDYTFSIRYDGLNRYYIVHVPQGYAPSSSAPLLLAFHGGGGDMSYMARDGFYGLKEKADQKSFIVVFPNGYSHFQSGKLATWNAGTCCGGARDNKIDDVGFVRQIIQNLTSQMNIDRDKIFATGMSNGGMMVERLACEMPDILKAVASVAGPDGTTQCHPSKPVSIMNIHARNDDHVLFNGGAGEGSFRDASQVTDFVSIPETIARWVKRNNCQSVPEKVLNVDGAYCDLYKDCAMGTQVELCVTETGGHSWPGGSKPGGAKRNKEMTSQAISADDIIWDFFMQQK